MNRQDPYKLARLRVKPSTLREYNRDLETFLEWGEQRKGKSGLHTSRDYDKLLNAFAIFTFERWNGRKRQLVVNVKCALELHLPWLKGKFKLTQTSLEGWATQVPFEQIPVCPWAVAALLSKTLYRSGKVGAAAATILAFDCYLRVGELTSLTRRDVIVTQSGAVIMLKATKRGRNQSVTIRNKTVVDFLRKRLAIISPDESLFAISDRTFRLNLHAAAAAVGLRELGITPHSLRYGGACHDYIQNLATVEQIMARGRWSNAQSIRRYLQPGNYYSQLQLLSPTLLAKAERHARKIESRF